MPSNRALGRSILATVGALALAHSSWAEVEPARTDFLSFAQGAIPVAIGGDPAARSNFEHAVAAVDGAVGSFPYTSLIDPTIRVEFVYELPAATRFDRFAVPGIGETPSPGQTFVRDVEVHGSSTSATDDFSLLASATLTTHAARGEVTELEIAATPPVRWVKLILSNGIDVQREKMFLEFSEIIGNGTQEPQVLADGFAGGWSGRGVAMLLQQDGALVSGCYDRGTGDLAGSVSGRILRATGADRTNGVGSAFIAVLGDNGAMRGLRSTNGAPFRLFEAERTNQIAPMACADSKPPRLGCGSVIHGINFDFDSAVIRPESLPILDQLHAGLTADHASRIVIEGHTSSEGSDAYNQGLSERRAAAVRDELVGRGLDAKMLASTGIGEGRPIATNDDESGRSLNRRVEVHCRE